MTHPFFALFRVPVETTACLVLLVHLYVSPSRLQFIWDLFFRNDEFSSSHRAQLVLQELLASQDPQEPRFVQITCPWKIASNTKCMTINIK